MEIALIAALAANRVIGHENRLIWRLPEDLQRFKQLTLGHTLIMGRKTWDSIGRPLPGRRTLVVTRQHDWQAAGAEVAHSLEEALQLATTGETARVYIAGGGELYRQALPIADVLLLTELADEFEGDAHFPEISTERDWQEISREAHLSASGLHFAFVEYRRR